MQPGHRLILAAGICLTLLMSSVSAVGQTPKPRPTIAGATASHFRLFTEPALVLTGNEFDCGLTYQGLICVNVFTSPFGEGGFWPGGSPNGYIWAAGLQIAGRITQDAGFRWAGDTVGAYFWDERGVQRHGDGITGIFNSLDRSDLKTWPSPGKISDFPKLSALVRDAELFEPTLLGRKAISQQDSWALYWDGDPAFSAQREHPMGILVEQRTLAWNYPAGNEATIYFIFRLHNITNSRVFQQLNEEALFDGRDELPDAGWRIDSIYVAFTTDPDVGNFSENHGTAILPLDLALAYDADFFETARFEYSPRYFYPPFFIQSPGLVGLMLAKTPRHPQTGERNRMTMFSIWDNPSAPGAGTGLLSALGIPQLWRYLSGNIAPAAGDGPCGFPDPQERRLCYLRQTPRDIYFFQSTGPFSLAPGESETLVVAMFAAATVATDAIVQGDAFANPPGIPAPRPGCEEPRRPIEIAAGWVATPPTACATPGDVDPYAIDYVPRSLVGKALVAQALVDNNFMLPQPPEPPPFDVAPGDSKVTITWQPSPTEEVGDPYHALASDSGSPLHNPNYRSNDVEGYRVYRGTTPRDLDLIAQFDRDDSKFVDHLCETDPSLIAGAVCRDTVEIGITSPFVQHRIGWIVRGADGSPTVVSADTALAGAIRNGTARPMTDNGVPFSFVDSGLRNGSTYYYKVTAFDLNSLNSGPSSLESPGDAKRVMPRVDAADDLRLVHTVPDPFYAASRFDAEPARRLIFVNLPERATIRIYSVAGRLVDVVNHHNPGGGGQAEWDLLDRQQKLVGSGVYFFHVTTPGGRQHIGKFTIINAPPF